MFNYSPIDEQFFLMKCSTPPALKVEVGQIWKGVYGFSINLQIEVLEITKDSVFVWNDFLGKFDFSIQDFLAKFEQVQP